MSFKVRIKSPAIREAQIKQSVEISTDAEPFFEFRSQKTMLKCISIPEDYLLYRMENFRTFTDQKEYIRREGKQINFFLAGQENESVQQIQHDILAILARKGKADSVTPVIDVLKTERQRESLLITTKGVVVNGNRRLSAMRELLSEDPGTFQEFRYIKCKVLPEDATPLDLLEIEAGLQGRPETKLDYDWVGDSELIKKLIEMGCTEKDVALRLHRRLPEIKNALAALTEADLYLKEWLGTEGDYTKVCESEQFFKDLPSLLQGKSQPLADASRLIAWNLHQNRDKLAERLYAYNVTIGKQAGEVLDRLSSEMGVSLSEPDEEDDDLFEVDIDAVDESPIYGPIAGLFADEETKPEAVETLLDICSTVVEQERGKKSGMAALKAIATANARLTEVDIGRADKSTYPSIKKQLEQIQKRTEQLLESVKNLTSAG